MKINQIEISKFRGIEETTLACCGDLNVLIGKNNSGKSTILDAIDGFFAVISSQSAVSTSHTDFGKKMDFHRNRDEEAPAINVAVFIQLNEPERRQIFEDIVSEAPQMKNALDAISADDRLRVQVTAITGRSSFAYVSKISFVHETDLDAANRVLLSIDQQAAIEIFEKVDSGKKAEAQSLEVLETGLRIDPEEYQMFRREDRIPRLTRRLGAANPEISYEIENLFRHTESYGDFRRQLEAMAASIQSAARRKATEPISRAVETFSGEAHEVPKYALSIIERISKISIMHLRDRRDPVGREEAQRLLSLKTRRKGPEVLRNIQEIVHSLLGVSIDAFESETTSSTRSENRAEMDVDEVLVEMNGAGIREALRLILDNELGAPDVLLVEEPEIHLHPALEISMLRYLKAASSRTQIFVTTHSTNFLDTSEMRNVYLTRRDPWVSVSLLDYEQAEAAIPDELGLRLSSLFMYDRLVFVEGPSDEAVLREIAPIVDVNLGQNNVGFVAMGSARNFTHYANEATVDLLAKRRVQMTFVLDRDEASEEEVAALVDRLRDLATVHVLKKRELENYLAVPAALARFICEKQVLAGVAAETDITAELVGKQLNECADKLKPLAVNKRVARTICSPVFFNRDAIFDDSSGGNFSERLTNEIDQQATMLSARAAEISSRIADEQHRIEQVWDSQKLDLVPGDELLDLVCQAFGVRFKKRRDGSRLASHLVDSEVPSELVDLLRHLVD